MRLEQNNNPRFGNAVQEYYLEKIRGNAELRRKRLAGIDTKRKALDYIHETRAAIRRIFSLPKEKTPLLSEFRGRNQYPDCFVDRIIFQSRPGFPVSANFYCPEHRTRPLPGVLFLCGHSMDGKGCETYQHMLFSLVKLGYAVLAPDPAAQGERIQYPVIPDAASFVGSCVKDHCMAGKQLLLSGESMSGIRLWDAVRSLDYLSEREEVDARFMFATGNSGGGTLTAFLNAVDDRLTAAAPSCYITSFLKNAENELPADSEQILTGMAANGLEMGDLLIASAPRPLLILGQKNDFFDVRGTRETLAELEKFYTLLGRKNSVNCFIGPSDHGFSLENREAVYSFFNGLLEKTAPVVEPEHRTVLPAELFCTVSGNLLNEKQWKTLTDFSRDFAVQCRKRRVSRSGDELREYFRREFSLPETTEIPHYRILRNEPVGKNVFLARFGIEEQGRLMAVLKIRNAGELYHLSAAEKILLLIPHLDAKRELLQPDWHETDPSAGTVCAGLDVRGTGEMTPSGCEQYAPYFFTPWNRDYHYASLGRLTRCSYLGGKVGDILRGTALLKSAGCGNISLTAIGQGCVPAVIAALYLDHCSLRLLDPPESWESMAEEMVCRFPESCMNPGILQETDLPELYALTRARIEHCGWELFPAEQALPQEI